MSNRTMILYISTIFTLINISCNSTEHIFEQVIVCPDGTHLVEDTCEFDEPPICSCPEGTHSELGSCVPDEIPTINCPEGMHLENEICEFDEPPTVDTIIVCWDKDNYCENRTDYPGCESPDPWIFGIEQKPSCAGEAFLVYEGENVCPRLPVETTCCSASKEDYENDGTINCTGDEFLPKSDCSYFGICQTNNPCVYSYCDERVNLCQHNVIPDGRHCEMIPYIGIGKEFDYEKCHCYKGQPYQGETTLYCWYKNETDDHSICQERDDYEDTSNCHGPDPDIWEYDEEISPLCTCDDETTFIPSHQACCYKKAGDIDGECLSQYIHKDNDEYNSGEPGEYSIWCRAYGAMCDYYSNDKCTDPENDWYYDNETLPPACECEDDTVLYPLISCYINNGFATSKSFDPYPQCWEDTRCFDPHPCVTFFCNENNRCNGIELSNTDYCNGPIPGSIDENCHCDEHGEPVYD